MKWLQKRYRKGNREIRNVIGKLKRKKTKKRERRIHECHAGSKKWIKESQRNKNCLRAIPRASYRGGERQAMKCEEKRKKESDFGSAGYRNKRAKPTRCTSMRSRYVKNRYELI